MDGLLDAFVSLLLDLNVKSTGRLSAIITGQRPGEQQYQMQVLSTNDASAHATGALSTYRGKSHHRMVTQ